MHMAHFNMVMLSTVCLILFTGCEIGQGIRLLSNSQSTPIPSGASAISTIEEKELAILRELIDGECQWGTDWRAEENTEIGERRYILQCHEAQTYSLEVTIARFISSEQARMAFDELRSDLPIGCFHGFPSKFEYKKELRVVSSVSDWQADRWVVAVSDRNDTFVHSQDVSEKIYRTAIRVGLFPAGECGTATPTDDLSPTAVVLPLGEYACEGLEYGLIASVGMVTFQPDGGFIDQAFYNPPSPGTIGTWYYDSAAQRIYFSENIEFAYAEYDAIKDVATVYLREGITRAHAEGGVIRCFKFEE
jgi:hypothetical protein